MQEKVYDTCCEICDKPITSDDCFSTCDNCNHGLCNKCKYILRKDINEKNIEIVKNCQICKTDVEQFCDHCKKAAYHDFEINGKGYENIGEFMKDNFDCCQCEVMLHCYKEARASVKEKYNLRLELFERGLDVLLCLECYREKYPDDSREEMTKVI